VMQGPPGHSGAHAAARHHTPLWPRPKTQRLKCGLHACIRSPR
jgi:hypothetical protein